jgi:hypothetical protein
MTIEPVAGTPGLWQAPGWSPGMPGLYAIVVGASAYPWLHGGDRWRHDHADYGLGQLVSSAATAAALFEWLRDGYIVDGRPLVWAGLLLSPTQAEAAEFAADGLTHFAPATYESLRHFILRWTGNMPRDKAPAQQSRSLFFFSGHGLQKNWDALILPSDYLSQELGQADTLACISVEELSRWLHRNPVAEHLLLVDACRNEASPLYEVPGTAHSFLPGLPAKLGAPRVVGVYQATAPNSQAYQLPHSSATIFGQAVLRGLVQAARPDGGDLVVDFADLVKFVQPAVKQALSPPLLDPPLPEPALRPYAQPLILNRLQAPAHALLQPPPVAPEPADLPAPLAAAVESASVAAMRSSALHNLRTPLPTARASLAAFDNFSDAHNLFQSERLTEFWIEGRFRLLDLGSGKEIPKPEVPIQVSQSRETSEVWLELALPPRPGPVVAVFDAPDQVSRGRLALPMPCDPHLGMPMDIGLRFLRAEDGRRTLVGLTGRLGDPARMADQLHEESAKAYGYLWEINRRARFGSLADVAAEASQDELERVLFGKLQHPTAAISAALLLARSGHLTHRPDWVVNLLQWHEQFADGPVLAAEMLRATAQSPRHPETLLAILALLEKMRQRGAPLFAGALDYAWSLLDGVTQNADTLPEAAKAPARLQVLEQYLRRLRNISMPAGQFVVLAGLPRPDWAAGAGTLSLNEMLAFHRPAPAGRVEGAPATELSGDEILQMVREAQATARADKQRREAMEVRSGLDTLINAPPLKVATSASRRRKQASNAASTASSQAPAGNITAEKTKPKRPAREGKAEASELRSMKERATRRSAEPASKSAKQPRRPTRSR